MESEDGAGGRLDPVGLGIPPGAGLPAPAEAGATGAGMPRSMAVLWGCKEGDPRLWAAPVGMAAGVPGNPWGIGNPDLKGGCIPAG